MPVLTQINLSENVLKAVQNHIDECREEIIKKAVSDFEKMVRSKVGNVVINALDYFSVERMGSEILIRVKFEGNK